MAAMQSHDYETASLMFEEYLKHKADDWKYTYRLAESYRHMGDYKKAEKLYQRVKVEATKKYPLAAYYQALMLKADNQCDEAIPIFDQFRKDYLGEKEDRKYRRLAKFNIEGCEKAKDSSKSLLIKPLSSAVNSQWVEGAPIFLGADQIAFNRMEKKAQTMVEGDQALPKRKYYLADVANGDFKTSGEWVKMGFSTNHEVVNGAFNPEGTRFYYTVCILNLSGTKNCDLFVKEKVGEKWSEGKKLNQDINTEGTETQPAVGLDEKGRETLYFVSDREEGKGGMDLWYTTYYADKDQFRKARNCGSKVNSIGDEITPFINPMNGKLFFSSDGHPGYGLFDVFKSSGQRSRWKEPKNIGASINGPQDEVYYVLSEDGKKGLFASNRPHPQKQALQACCDDLFFFQALDQVVLKVKTKLKSESDKLELEAAYLNIYSRDSSGELFFTRRLPVDADGSVDFYLEAGEDYVIKANAENHLVASQMIHIPQVMSQTELELDLKLKAIEDKAYPLENIYYEFGKAELTAEAYTTIDTTIYRILIENPEIVVEIGSHTDSKGTEAYNKSLSQKRAESVVEYLRKKGIAKNRMTAKGYGESNPIAPNTLEDGSDNPEGRAQNRRTVFKVIGQVNLIEDDD